MNKKILFLTTVIVFIFFSSCKPLKNEGSISEKTDDTQFLIVSYNVENLFDIEDDPHNSGDNDWTPNGKKKWTQERYNKKISDLAKVISSINDNELPDIVGLCEVENIKVLEDLIADTLLSANEYGIAHEPSPDPRGIDVALIYKKSEFEYISHEAIEIKLADNAYYHTRDILHVIGIINEKDTLHVFVNHWKSRAGGSQEETEIKRVNAARILREKVDMILKNNENANIVILGDMNDEPQNKSIAKTLNATNNKNATDIFELYNTLLDKDLEDKGTYNYKGNWNMLDNIIISQNLLKNRLGYHIGNNEGEIFKEEWFMFYQTKIDEFIPSKTYGGKNYYGGYSDHLAVYLILNK